MKQSLLAATAMGTVMAMATAAHAEGWGMRVFGGYNLIDDIHVGTFKTSGSTSFFTNLGPTLFGFNYASGASRFLTSESLSLNADGGFVVGASVGHGFPFANVGQINVEVEGAYRRNKFDVKGAGLRTFSFFTRTYFHATTILPSLTFPVGSTAGAGSTLITPSGDGRISAYSVMANAWYEFETGTAWKPYLGGGAGVAWLDVDGDANLRLMTSGGATSTTSIKVSAEESGFAWQLGAGLGYEFAENKQIMLDYRYFRGPELDSLTASVGGAATVVDPDYEYDAHSLMLGFKAGF